MILNFDVDSVYTFLENYFLLSMYILWHKSWQPSYFIIFDQKRNDIIFNNFRTWYSDMDFNIFMIFMNLFKLLLMYTMCWKFSFRISWKITKHRRVWPAVTLRSLAEFLCAYPSFLSVSRDKQRRLVFMPI